MRFIYIPSPVREDGFWFMKKCKPNELAEKIEALSKICKLDKNKDKVKNAKNELESLAQDFAQSRVYADPLIIYADLLQTAEKNNCLGMQPVITSLMDRLLDEQKKAGSSVANPYLPSSPISGKKRSEPELAGATTSNNNRPST